MCEAGWLHLGAEERPVGGDQGCMQVEMLRPCSCTIGDNDAAGSVTPRARTSSECNKWGKHQWCVAAACKHGSVLRPAGWCLSLTRSHTNTGICKNSYHPFGILSALIKKKVKLILNWSASHFVCSPPTDSIPLSLCLSPIETCV